MFACFTHRNRRRGVTAIFVAVSLPVIVGFAALTIDTGLQYNSRTKLQNAADAAALAAVQALGGADVNASVLAARTAAERIIALNPIWNGHPASGTQITFGQTRPGPGGAGLNFVPNAMPPNAVSVTTSYNLQYTFASALGVRSKMLSATAVSAIAARDIVFVLDVSCTMGELSDTFEIAADLTNLGAPFIDSDSGVDRNGDGDSDSNDPYGDSGRDKNGNGDSDDSDSDHGLSRVMLCHIPKGNVAKRKTISISSAEVPGHQAHGDTLGACASEDIGCNGNGNP